MRKGYMYALEGVIAGMLVVFYIGSMVQNPEQTSWDDTVLTQRAGDLMNVYSRTGLLEESVVENKPDKLEILTDVIGGGVDYSFEVNNIPQSFIEVGILRKGEDYLIEETEVTSFTETGDIESKDGADIREGTVQDVEFILIDSLEDGEQRYDAVYFDVNGDGSYGETEVTDENLLEGPYRVGQFFEMCFDEDCKEVKTYQVGYIDQNLVLYDMEDVSEIVNNQKTVTNRFGIEFSFSGIGVTEDIDKECGEECDIDINGLTVEFTNQDGVISHEYTELNYGKGDNINIFGQSYNVTSTDPLRLEFDERLDQEVLLLKNQSFNFVENLRQPLENFLLRDGILVELGNLSEVGGEKFSGSFRNDLGLSYSEPDIEKYGPGYSIIPEEGSPQKRFLHSFFYDNPIRIGAERFQETNQDHIKEAEIVLGGNSIKVEYNEDDEKVIFEEQITKEEGEEVLLGNNNYYIRSIFPLELVPREEHKFEGIKTENIQGEQKVLEMPRWEYNYSEMDINSEYEGVNQNNLDGEGLPEAGCSLAGPDKPDNKYFTGDIEAGSKKYPFVVTDIDCDGDIDYVNFNFRTDDDYFSNSSSENRGSFSRDGIYQENELVTINQKTYRIRFEEDTLHLEAEGERKVGAAYWNSDVYRGHGNYFYMGDMEINDDIGNFLQTVFIRGSVRKHEFTTGSQIGTPNVGIMFSDDIEGSNYIPYTLETIWWFK